MPLPALPPPTVYHCPGGPAVTARFLDAKTVVLRFAGRRHRLRAAMSADGGRYIGEGWQWWVKGMRSAALDPLPQGQTIVPASRWCAADRP